jgi:hypothetical protein
VTISSVLYFRIKQTFAMLLTNGTGLQLHSAKCLQRPSLAFVSPHRASLSQQRRPVITCVAADEQALVEQALVAEGLSSSTAQDAAQRRSYLLNDIKEVGAKGKPSKAKKAINISHRSHAGCQSSICGCWAINKPVHLLRLLPACMTMRPYLCSYCPGPGSRSADHVYNWPVSSAVQPDHQ